MGKLHNGPILFIPVPPLKYPARQACPWLGWVKAWQRGRYFLSTFEATNGIFQKMNPVWKMCHSHLVGFILSGLAWHDGHFLITGNQQASQCHLEIGTHCFLNSVEIACQTIKEYCCYWKTCLEDRLCFWDLKCIYSSMYLEQTSLRAHRFLRHQPARNCKYNVLKQPFSPEEPLKWFSGLREPLLQPIQWRSVGNKAPCGGGQ